MDNVQSVQAIYEAFGRGDVPGILNQLSDEIEWDQDAPAYGVSVFEPGVGKEHVKRFFQTVQQDLEFIKFEPGNFLSGGNQVAVPVNVEAKVNPTGNMLKFLEVHLWTFGHDGKVTRFFHCNDRHAAVLAYGL
jgi:uncharacterized protein